MNTDEIREKLDAEIQQTKSRIAEYKEMSVPEAPDCAIGRVSRMDAINNRSVMEAALRQAEEKLKKLHYVSEKLGTAGFGLCLRCKQPIPIARILFKPESAYCVRCAK